MAFQDDLARHAEQIRTRLPHIRGEEATKQALVIPLLQLLGYDVFDPREVLPEYTADFAVKRNGQLEKIDYAICSKGDPVLFIECKAHDQRLEDHSGQLARYFNATPSVRIAILTNGIELKVFTDLQQPNVMDPNPWLLADLRALNPVELDALRRLRKGDFDASAIVELAEEMVYYNRMVAFMAAQLREPGDGFVQYVAREVLPGTRLTKGLVERLTPILAKAIKSAILNNVAQSFAGPATPEPAATSTHEAAREAPPAPDSSTDNIVTTDEELRCYSMIDGWIREVNKDAALALRDSKTYLTIHQDNVRKWFVRLNVQKPPYWAALRHVMPEELRVLAPGVNLGSVQFGDSRVMLGDSNELVKLRTAIIAAYERELTRRAEEAAVEPT